MPCDIILLLCMYLAWSFFLLVNCSMPSSLILQCICVICVCLSLMIMPINCAAARHTYTHKRVRCNCFGIGAIYNVFKVTFCLHFRNFAVSISPIAKQVATAKKMQIIDVFFCLSPSPSSSSSSSFVFKLIKLFDVYNCQRSFNIISNTKW